MANIIKTAIITIIISFISGLLLEYYKNLAPRILCNIRNALPIKINSKRLCAYIVTINNVSNKTIHDLTLYIQSSQTNLRIKDAKITKGLKFDSSIKDNTLDINIPFLSKDDKFSVTVYSEDQHIMSKPVIILRSPENFKQIDSLKQNGLLFSLLNIPKDISDSISNMLKKHETIAHNEKDDFTMVMNRPLGSEETLNRGNRKIPYRNKKPSKSKKGIIVVVSIALLVFVGVLAKSYFKGAANASTPVEKTVAPTQSTDVKNSSGGSTKNTGSRTSNGRTTGNTNSKTSSAGSTENADSKVSTDESTKNTDLKSSTGESSGNTSSKTSTEGTSKNTDSNSSTEGTTKNTDSKASTGESNGNTGSKNSTGGEATGSSDSKASTGNTSN